MAIRISDLIDESRVLLPMRAGSKKDAIDELTDLLVRLEGREDLRQGILDSVWEREMEISTGIGRGIAIPHAEIDMAIGPMAVIGISPAGIDFEALDSRPVHVAFLLVVSNERPQARLSVLSRLSRLFGRRPVRHALAGAATAADVVAIIRANEETE